MKRPIKLSAFTLVELAIVIVIIGLLVAGVVGAQSLIESSKTRSVISEIEKINLSVNAFKLEYDGLPGDLRNATDYWGAISGNCRTTTGTGTQTCNGDGDNLVESYIDNSAITENYRFWQHLSNAGLVNGQYTGISSFDCSENSGYACFKQGSNMMESKIDGAFWVPFYGKANGGWGGVWRGKPEDRNIIVLGARTNQLTGWNEGSWYGRSLRPKQTKNIDSKIDDGKPFTGKVVISDSFTCPSWICQCSTSTYNTNATYKLSETGKTCNLMVDSGY